MALSMTALVLVTLGVGASIHATNVDGAMMAGGLAKSSSGGRGHSLNTRGVAPVNKGGSLESYSLDPKSQPLFQGNPRNRSDARAAAGTAIGISYHGGPVMVTKTVNIYIIWMGGFSAAQKQLVRDFIASLNYSTNPSNTVSRWWTTNTNYYLPETSPLKTISPIVKLAGEYTAGTDATWGVNNGVLGTVYPVVYRAIAGAPWPTDSNGVYAVLTSSNITQAGGEAGSGKAACQNYCGWHDSSGTIKYLWAGIPKCLDNCAPSFWSSGQYTSPSLDVGVHSMISVFAHELAEATSDPQLNAWYDAMGYENADKCAWQFGTVYATGSAVYNLGGVNSNKFLVQMNWDPVGGKCVQGVGPLSWCGGDSLVSNGLNVLSFGQKLQSTDCRFSFVFQGDANIVLYMAPSQVLWASNTMGRATQGYLMMQGDGNLVAYSSPGRPFWASGSNGLGVAPFVLVVQSDGNVVIADAKGKVIWSTRTCCH